jgi:hypothetical protein
MQIDLRPLERIVATVLVVVAIRVVAPLPSMVYTHLAPKLIFSALIGGAGVWLLLARNVHRRRQSLRVVLITCLYLVLLSVYIDWTRFGSIAAFLGLAAITGFLYRNVRAKEIEWKPDGSSRSSPPQPPSSER